MSFLYIHVSVFSSNWFLCPETLTLKSLMASLLSEIRSLRLILYFYCPGPVNGHFPVKTLIPFSGKWVLETTQWMPGAPRLLCCHCFRPFQLRA